ncbi:MULTISPECIES: ATP-dependent DNA ligase [Streptomyces]|uniref:ATP-dependent DNA ligase n=1 Tax=Streptomyces solicathayae TaxID=3081768 RepID=A0ABZ0LRW3_9ACTN|nr:ATP-dependent DNA ligase [Streptomyces sp. HUAS YS2]WOX22080.1 ATP-dependent DNA ligase [Streptomyces sp. HUAS YS2]
MSPAGRPGSTGLPAGLDPPVRVALARSVGSLPRGAGLAYEPKFDGHRMVVLRYPGDKVLLQARSGRIVTAAFPDLAEAARELPAGTVLDGEVVVWREGRTDFAAVQARAAATPARAPALARRLPASYAAFDVLAEGGTDLRAKRYEVRRERLVALLGPLGPPLQPVPMTTDPELAVTWYETLPEAGVEGLVVKRLDSTYRGGARLWEKLRHTDTRDAVVVGYTGPAQRPSALVLVVPDDDTPALSSPLAPALRIQAGRALGVPAAGAEDLADDDSTVTAVGVGEVPYRRVPPELTAEVARGTTRQHNLITVLRLRTTE